MTIRMPRRAAPTLVMAGSLVLVLAACSTALARQTTPISAATSSDATQAAGLPTTEAATRVSTAPIPAGAVRLTLSEDASKASYRAREQLVGRALPNDAIGTTQAVSGAIVLNQDGTVLGDQSAITVDLRSLQSDESRRDGFIQRSTLQTDQYPTATFVPRAVEGLPSPLPTSGTAMFQLSGDLTVHGATRPVTWEVAAQFDQQAISGTANTTFKLTDFGMTPPKAGPVLSIEDSLGLQVDFHFTREPAVTA
jgi:polyisoprenoid-binding protein YceI